MSREGALDPGLQVVGRTCFDQWKPTPIRYTIVYKLYGLFIYSYILYMYLCDYMYGTERIIPRGSSAFSSFSPSRFNGEW